jgi:hypothetical protein
LWPTGCLRVAGIDWTWLLHAPPGLQAIGWQPEELAERLGRRDPLALEALRVGVVVQGELPALPTPEPA